jgi:hypothetical protein
LQNTEIFYQKGNVIMAIRSRKIVHSTSLKSLVQSAYHKYASMEQNRLDVNNIPLINLVSPNLRNSKLDKLGNLIKNKKSTELELANAILALQKEANLGTKLKALVDVLSICAETTLNKKHFDNAKERLAAIKATSFDDASSAAAFNFTKAFQNIIVENALKLVNKIESDLKKSAIEKHTHAQTPATPTINSDFISAEKSKRIQELKEFNTVAINAAFLKAVQVNQLAQTVANLDVQLTNAEEAIEDHLTLEEELTQHLTNSQMALEMANNQLAFQADAADLDKAELRMVKQHEKLVALEKSRDVILKQGREINKLTRIVEETQDELDDALEDLRSADQMIAQVFSERDFVINDANAVIGEAQSVINQLAVANAYVKMENLELHERVQDSKQDNTDLRKAKVWEMKVERDKMKEVIKRQGREINSLKGYDSVSQLRAGLFNQRQTVDTQTDVAFNNVSHANKRSSM